ncbi:hypothetical protein, partial [uncultured Slackia sp.]|uniref:hypothetical protein n=1 Tax=uncultured Slackia sp. TaxID=665903 RepID=UPI00258590C9
PSPKVLQRQAAGGQGVALMQGASAYIQGLCPFFSLRLKRRLRENTAVVAVLFCGHTLVSCSTIV